MSLVEIEIRSRDPVMSVTPYIPGDGLREEDDCGPSVFFDGRATDGTASIGSIRLTESGVAIPRPDKVGIKVSVGKGPARGHIAYLDGPDASFFLNAKAPAEDFARIWDLALVVNGSENRVLWVSASFRAPHPYGYTSDAGWVLEKTKPEWFACPRVPLEGFIFGIGRAD